MCRNRPPLITVFVGRTRKRGAAQVVTINNFVDTVMSKIKTQKYGWVTLLELCNPPNNYFDIDILTELADAVMALDEDPQCRALVLASEGKHFCAGGNFGSGEPGTGYEIFSLEKFADNIGDVYRQGARLLQFSKPIVAAVQGAATGGGLGLALVADFRVASPATKFWANFAKLGIHTGFGATVTLPRVVGQQAAQFMLMTGRKVRGEEAMAIGLADLLSSDNDIRQQALNLAQEIAANAPLAIQSMRAVTRRDLYQQVLAAIDEEVREQCRLRATEDFQEGVRAIAQKREGEFIGR